jgi:hypothetical protein
MLAHGFTSETLVDLIHAGTPSTIPSAIITKPIADAQCGFHGHA